MQFGIAIYDALISANVAPDKAKSVVTELEKEIMDKLATKKDLESLEQKLIIKLPAIIFAGFGFFALVQKFFS